MQKKILNILSKRKASKLFVSYNSVKTMSIIASLTEGCSRKLRCIVLLYWPPKAFKGSSNMLDTFCSELASGAACED